MTEVFVDTALVIALLLDTDQYHGRAWSSILEMRPHTRFVTTRAVCLEVGASLARPRYRAQAAAILASIDGDPNFEVIPLSEDLFAAALSLFTGRPDKSWSLTDCLSFVVMQQRGISTALTTDQHFRQAGFEPLLA